MALTRKTYQRNSNWNAPYTFSGKEKDAETGYGYFGARYYDSGLSVWLSVDPLSDKYPTLSPYTYCANNPIMMVDPDGRKISIFGKLAQAVVDQLNNYTKMGLKLDGNQLKYETKGTTQFDLMLMEAIDNDLYDITIYADDVYNLRGLCKMLLNAPNGGAYLGNEVDKDEHGNVTKVKAKQFVNPRMLSEWDISVKDKIIGGYMVHEFAEVIFGAFEAKEKGVGSPHSEAPNSNYPTMHIRANSIMCGDRTQIWSPVIESEIYYFNPKTNFFGKIKHLSDQKLIGHERK
jgi:RHS repeat-associated protein